MLRFPAVAIIETFVGAGEVVGNAVHTAPARTNGHASGNGCGLVELRDTAGQLLTILVILFAPDT